MTMIVRYRNMISNMMISSTISMNVPIASTTWMMMMTVRHVSRCCLISIQKNSVDHSLLQNRLILLLLLVQNRYFQQDKGGELFHSHLLFKSENTTYHMYVD